MGLFFYPRGGSSQVAGYLSRALESHGWHVTLCCGSLGEPAPAATRPPRSTASTSSPPPTTTRSPAGSAAATRWTRRFRCTRPTRHRAGVPDRAFPWVSPAQGGRMTAAWARLMAGSEAISRSRLLHLHHLTPLHDAAARVLPDVPVLTHLHGTELKMLDAIARDMPALDAGPHADWWASRMPAAALRRDRHDHHLALRARPRPCACSGSTRTRCTACRTASTSTVSRRPARPTTSAASTGSTGSYATRRAGTRRPASPAASATPRTRCSTRSSTPPPASAGRCCCSSGGSSASSACRCWSARTPGRASGWRCPRRSSSGAACPASGRGSTRTPSRTREGVAGVFFSGWRGHDELPLGLGCADCFVAPSTDEPFGLVYLEAMACELPVIGDAQRRPAELRQRRRRRAGRLARAAGRRGGPRPRRSSRPSTVRRSASAAARTPRSHARESHSWDSAAARLSELYEACATTSRLASSR